MSDSERRISGELEDIQQLLQSLRPAPLDPARRICVNRDLRMDLIETVGFDMDYTLALYSRPHIEELAFRLTAQRLVHRGYPPKVLDLRYEPELSIRGLVVDKKLGTILKMDRHRHVGIAYRGRRQLSKEERRSLYRTVRIRTGLPRYHLIDTLFGLPEVALFCEIVDVLEADKSTPRSSEQIFSDIRSSIDEVHRDGTLKSKIRKDLAQYFVTDPLLPQTLHRFRSSGKRLFLLTNSMWDYTNAVMSFVLDGQLPQYPSWRNYFDVIVVGANKPAFFVERHPFVILDERGRRTTERHRRFERGTIYEAGNLPDFETMAGTGGDRILYIGDHIYGDMLRSKKHSAWRTALVVEELEEEIALLIRHREDFARIRFLEARCKDLDTELNYLATLLKTVQRAIERSDAASERPSALESARRRIRGQIDENRVELKESLEELDRLAQRCESKANAYWGLLFREGLELSRFADQVQDFACIYTSRVSNFLNYSPMQYFRSSRGLMPHERI